MTDLTLIIYDLENLNDLTDPEQRELLQGAIEELKRLNKGDM